MARQSPSNWTPRAMTTRNSRQDPGAGHIPGTPAPRGQLDRPVLAASGQLEVCVSDRERDNGGDAAASAGDVGDLALDGGVDYVGQVLADVAGGQFGWLAVHPTSVHERWTLVYAGVHDERKAVP